MEALGALFGVGLVLFFLVGPWILVLVGRGNRKREREEDQARWQTLSRRLDDLVNAVALLRNQVKGTAPVQTPPAEARVAEPAANTAEPSLKEPAAVPPTPAKTVEPLSTASQRLADAQNLRAPAPSTLTPPPPVSSKLPLITPPRQVADLDSAFSSKFKSSIDVEEAVGRNLLNKLGITLVVLGVAFGIVQGLKTLGPGGKIGLGYLIGATLLGAGVWLERNERYRILARAGIGGGWAVLFFTTYAMYHVPAAHVLDSQIADLVLMLAVAAAMVWHTLRYRSQVVTGLSFLLAFLTVAINHGTVYSLAAGAVLAAGLVVIIGRMQWFELEIFGILASYFNHFLWLYPIISAMQGRHRPFPEFAGSTTILFLYWVAFRVSYVFRNPSDETKERVSTFAALLNTSLLLLLLKYQSTHPEWAFWTLLAVGAAETALGQLPITRRRRTAVIVLSTLGIVLLIAAFPFRYSGTRLSVLWLMEAEALLLIGVWTREVIFRRLGMSATALVAGQMISYDAARILGRRMDGADVGSELRIALMFAVASLIFYANGHWVFRRWHELFVREFDQTLMKRLSYVAAVLAAIAAWVAFPESWTAVAWVAVGVLLLFLGQYFNIAELGYQGTALALVAFFRALAVNLEAEQKIHGVSLRLITMALTAILLYVAARWKLQELAEQTEGFSFARLFTELQSWGATFLLALLAWYELRSISVAVAWAVGGLLLAEIGLARKSLSLRLQGYVLFLAAFTRIFFVNLNAAGLPGEVSPRFYTVVPIALAFFYAYWRLFTVRENLSSFEEKFKFADLSCYLGTISFAALMRFEVPADWVAAAWAGLAFALIAIAWRSGQRLFLHQGLLVVFAVLFRTVLHNFYERSYFPAPLWESRWITAGSVIALLFAALAIAFRVRRKDEIGPGTGFVRLITFTTHRPEQVFFFVAIGLLTVLLALEMDHGRVTLSWGLEGLLVFLFAIWVNERSFRLTGLGLLLLCAAKILLIDVWRLNPRDRYITFIVLGAVLLVVSFMYSRYREAIRQYL